MVTYNSIQVIVGLISESNFVYPNQEKVILLCHSVAYFSRSLLVSVTEFVVCGDFVRELSHVLSFHLLNTCY